MLSGDFDCLAVPLPPSFQHDVEQGVEHLPNVTIACQQETDDYVEDWNPEGGEKERIASYVPIDPCQPVIAAIRIAMQEHLTRAFVDLEVESFEPHSGVLPDPYALKQVSAEQFATAVLPAVGRPQSEQLRNRIHWMAQELRRLEKSHKSILFICSILDWPWIREAYKEGDKAGLDVISPEVYATELFGVDPITLIFLLGELPFITSLYEEARYTLDDDENLSIDGVKELLLVSREKYKSEHSNRGRKITPHLLRTYLKYIRNLSLIERRMTPDLYTLIMAAKQMLGDLFAVSLAETAREYKFQEWLPLKEFKMSLERGQFPNGDLYTMKNRLPGHPTTWRSCNLNRKPPELDKKNWQTRWNPFSHCSWPPEDVAIERFRTHVKDRALSIMGNDLARVEKFTSSIKDGLDIRETLRNWHTGELYVKENPPSRGSLDCVLMFFDSPSDPRGYPCRITWHAEHQDESTLAFYSTAFEENMVGPGIALATYGGAMFLFPPRSIPDVWQDRRFDVVDTLEERLLIAACHHSKERHLAVLASAPPGLAWRRLAKRYNKKLVHVPLNSFSQETVQQLRMFHVLNGHQVRSYAEHFIRKA